MEKAYVVVADDHAVVRAGICNALQSLAYLEVVAEVGNGKDLLAVLARWQPDLLVTDVTMPDFEPIATVRQICEQYPNLRVLVVSAYDDDVYVQGLLGAGAHGYHLKDQSMRDLCLAVEQVLQGKRWVSSALLDRLLPHTQTTLAPQLSPRQLELLELLYAGLDNRGLAQQLGISLKTVENHLTRLYRQLNVQSRLEAVHYLQQHPQVLARSASDALKPSFSKFIPQNALLLVDDNARYRMQLQRIISKIAPQVQVLEAANTAAALAQLAHHPQLALVDVVIGDEDGLRCTRQLKNAQPNLRILLMSAYPDREFHRLGLQAGAIAFVDKKDLDIGALQQILADNLLFG